MSWQNHSIAGQQIHFAGAGGIGVSALLELAAAGGAFVTGCDREESPQVQKLREHGHDIVIGQDADHIVGCDQLVFSSAIPLNHPELVMAGSKAVRRGAFLAELMSGFKAVGVAGAHGKTTTTAMLAHILITCQRDPTVVLGGHAPCLGGGNWRRGEGDLFLAELDESDGTFLLPNVKVAAVTNIESEHLQYYGSDEALFASYRLFLQKTLDNHGTVLLSEQAAMVAGPSVTERSNVWVIGRAESCNVRILRNAYENVRQVVKLQFRNRGSIEAHLPVAGVHNGEDAAIAMATAHCLGLDLVQAAAALERFRPVERRMQLVGRKNGVRVYTDYAHHPTEVRAALSALQTVCGPHVLVVFQPHLYSRTRDFAEEFGRVLARASSVYLTPIYPARERKIEGVSSQLIVDAVLATGKDLVPMILPADVIVEEVIDELAEQSFDAVLVAGAGDIWTVAHALVD